ncbi:MAG: helix-turn-helix transcriptional regulator [Lewinellaceae bacterium]|nr:helix-turn-helix transcriptional regulator [Lewinellaceae bacterium]
MSRFLYTRYDFIQFLADNLQYLRKRKRLSQGELANALGLSRSQIASYEHDKAEPSVNKLAKIAVFFST